jgi:hypothetical protein
MVRTSRYRVQCRVGKLRDYRRELEKAIAFFGSQDPVLPIRAVMQARLDAVIAEQDDRARIARA